MSGAMPKNIKVVVIGNINVGKSHMLHRLLYGEFVEYPPINVGSRAMIYNIEVDGEVLELLIYDTGREEYNGSLPKNFFRNTYGAILVFSPDDNKSFADLGHWLSDLRSNSEINSAVLLVCNKADLVDKRVITQSMGESFAKSHNFQYLEVSAKDGTNVHEAFVLIASLIKEGVKSGNLLDPYNTPSSDPIVRIDNSQSRNDKRQNC